MREESLLRIARCRRRPLFLRTAVTAAVCPWGERERGEEEGDEGVSRPSVAIVIVVTLCCRLKRTATGRTRGAELVTTHALLAAEER